MTDQKTKTPESCGLTMHAHLGEVIMALAFAGVGYDCPEAYQALAIMAEFYRRAGGHTEPCSVASVETLMNSARQSTPEGERYSVGLLLRAIGQHPDQRPDASLDVLGRFDDEKVTRH